MNKSDTIRGVLHDRAFWGVVLLGLILRLGLLIWAAANGVPLESTDTPTYTRPALSFLATGTFSQDEHSPYAIDILRTPGYPLFLAAIWRIDSSHAAVPIAVTQALLSAATIGLIYAAARQIAGQRAAVIAALLIALETMSAALPSYLLSDTLYQFAVALWLVLLLCHLKGGSWQSLTAVSIVAGLSLYVRPMGLLFPLAAAFLILAARDVPLRRRAIQATVALILPVALIFPWSVRNKLGADTWEFTTIASVNMLRYRAAKVMSMAEGKDFYTTAREELEHRATDLTPADAKPGRRVAIQRQVAIDYMMKHPWITARAYATGAAVLLAVPDRWTLPHLLGIDEKGGTLHAGGGWTGKLRRLFEQYHPLTLCYMAWAGIYTATTWLLATVGLVRLWRRGDRRMATALLLVLLFLIIASAVPESEPRLRLPLLVPLAVLAGVAWIGPLRKPLPADSESRVTG